MITIGVAAHKRVHVAVAVDEAGCEIARWHGPNSVAGWQGLAAWAATLGPDCRWGIEGAWNDGCGLAQQLVGVGAAVYAVHPRWTAEGRRHARRSDKNDRLDARAIALYLRREAATLTALVAEDDTTVLALLVTERDDRVAESTRLRNQLQQLLLPRDPESAAHRPSPRTQGGVRNLEGYTSARPCPLRQRRAAGVKRLAQRSRLVTEQAKALAAQIRALAAKRITRLTAICGVSVLTAGEFAGLLGPGRCFASDAQLAAFAGVAPLEISSAGRVRHRLNRGGNRRLNAIL